MGSRETHAIAGFASRKYSRSKGAINRGASEMYRSRRKRCASGGKSPRIRRRGSVASRMRYSQFIEKYRRSPGSVRECFLGARARFPIGAAELYESRRRRGASFPGIKRPGATADRIGSAWGYREIPDVAGFGLRALSRCEGAIYSGRARHVRKSAKTRREWGEWLQNQATRADCQSVRTFTTSREIKAIARFGFRTHSRRMGERLSGGAPIMYKSRRKRGAIGAKGPRIRRPGSTASRLGQS